MCWTIDPIPSWSLTLTNATISVIWSAMVSIIDFAMHLPNTIRIHEPIYIKKGTFCYFGGNLSIWHRCSMFQSCWREHFRNKMIQNHNRSHNLPHYWPFPHRSRSYPERSWTTNTDMKEYGCIYGLLFKGSVSTWRSCELASVIFSYYLYILIAIRLWYYELNGL